MHGPVRRRPDGCGLGRGLLGRADDSDITAARRRSESLLRCSDVIARMHTSHAPPRSRIGHGVSGGTGAEVDADNTELALTIYLSTIQVRMIGYFMYPSAWQRQNLNVDIKRSSE